MSAIKTAAFVLIGVAIYDWFSVTGMSAKIISYKYKYWPPSMLRWFGIAGLAFGALITFAIMTPPEPASILWVLLPAIFGLAAHLFTTLADFARQKRESASTVAGG